MKRSVPIFVVRFVCLAEVTLWFRTLCKPIFYLLIIVETCKYLEIPCSIPFFVRSPSDGAPLSLHAAPSFFLFDPLLILPLFSAHPPLSSVSPYLHSDEILGGHKFSIINSYFRAHRTLHQHFFKLFLF